MQKNIYKYLLISVFAIITFSCEDNRRSPIPDYPVYLELDLLGEYNTFYNSRGQSLVFIEPRKATERLGFGGILVCTNSWGEYCAFDLACPYEAKRDLRVRPDGLVAVCDSCGSKFDLWETALGVPQGPSKFPLKKYRTSVSVNKLVIFR
ncbi:MAG: hypothetical protein FWF72_05890 [Paludibacter sp.]|nr:hypothetical protein [Paludibacter sp.]